LRSSTLGSLSDPHPAVPTVSTCSTRIGTVELVWRGANAPPSAAPVADQLTAHVTVEVTGNAPSFGFPSSLGCPAEDVRYVYEQSVVWAPEEIAGL